MEVCSIMIGSEIDQEYSDIGEILVLLDCQIILEILGLKPLPVISDNENNCKLLNHSNFHLVNEIKNEVIQRRRKVNNKRDSSQMWILHRILTYICYDLMNYIPTNVVWIDREFNKRADSCAKIASNFDVGEVRIIDHNLKFFKFYWKREEKSTFKMFVYNFASGLNSLNSVIDSRMLKLGEIGVDTFRGSYGGTLILIQVTKVESGDWQSLNVRRRNVVRFFYGDRREYHLGIVTVCVDGSICLNIIKNMWCEELNIYAATLSFQPLLCDPKPSSCKF